MAKLLIIDDDEALYRLLSDFLGNGEFDCAHAADAKAGLRRLGGESWDAVILDVMLPGMNGLEVLKTLRRRPATRRLPVLMLTARGEEADKVLGLEQGADDYLAKPFGAQELLARLRALLRRAGGAVDAEREAAFALDDMIIDKTGLRATVGAAQVELTAAELRLLEALASAPGRPVGRERLYRYVYGHAAFACDRSLDMLVSRLRRKLGPRADGGERIRAVWGEGYAYLLSEARD